MRLDDKSEDVLQFMEDAVEKLKKRLHPIVIHWMEPSFDSTVEVLRFATTANGAVLSTAPLSIICLGSISQTASIAPASQFYANNC